MHLERPELQYALPYPLARLLKRLNAPEPPQQFEWLLRIVEGVARYTWAILVAEAAATGVDDGTLQDWITRNSFGTCLHAIDQCLRRRAQRPDRVVPELESLFGGRSRKFLDAMVNQRNDIAHHRLVPASHAAQDRLAAIEADFDAFLGDLEFLARYPIGAIRAVRNLPDGASEGQWVTYRGIDLSNRPVPLTDARGMPSDLVLLMDPTHRRALCLAPLFVVVEDAFCWLDLPRSAAPPRGVYARPGSSDAVPSAVPMGIFDVRPGTGSTGLSLKAWLNDREQRPRLIELHLNEASWDRARTASWPTQGLSLLPPSAARHSPPPSPTLPLSASPVAFALPTPPVAPTQVFPPPPGAYVPSGPPAPTVLSLPPPSARTATTTRSNRTPLYAAGTAGALGVALLLGWAMSSRAAANASRNATAPTDRVSLLAHPGLRTAVLRWAAAATDSSVRDPVTGEAFAPTTLEDFYVRSPGFHGMRDVTVGGIADRWRERRIANRFTIRLENSTVEPLPPERASPRCRSEGRVAVVLVSVDATEEGSMVVAGNPRGHCTRVAGPYLLQMRAGDGGWSICNESWHFARALCASCPGAWTTCARATN